MSSFDIKKVSFDECITIRHYEYDKDEELKAKKGCDWQRTSDLIHREFSQSKTKGGCGNDWCLFQQKLDEIEEPDWCLVGQLWRQLYQNKKRIEETSSSEESDEESDEEL